MIRLLLALAVAIWFFFKNLPGALLFIWPGWMRARETDDDGSLDPDSEPAMARVDSDLRELGFTKVGAIQVSPPLSLGWAELCYAAKDLFTFADIDARGGALHVTLFTPFASGEAVVTSDFRRPGRETPRLLLGGLPQSDLPALWAAHRRRMGRLSPEATPWSDFTIGGRVAADESFYRGGGEDRIARPVGGRAGRGGGGLALGHILPFAAVASGLVAEGPPREPQHKSRLLRRPILSLRRAASSTALLSLLTVGFRCSLLGCPPRFGLGLLATP